MISYNLTKDKLYNRVLLSFIFSLSILLIFCYFSFIYYYLQVYLQLHNTLFIFLYKCLGLKIKIYTHYKHTLSKEEPG